MANLWLRLYHDMPNDPKWRTIARVSKQPIPLVLAVYLHLLVIASQATDRGAVMNVSPEDIASALDADSGAIEAVLVGMNGRVIDDDRLSGWDKRQVAREDGASERAKKWRENRTQPNADERKRTHANANERQIKSREEEINTKAKAKPSRGKRESDPRHEGFKAAVIAYGAFKRVKLQWDASEGKQLGLLLSSAPDLTLKEFQDCLNHRARSPGTPHGERPRLWLPNILRYQQGPLNTFNRTEEPNANPSKFERSQASTARVLNEFLTRKPDMDLAADSGGRTLEAGS